jgi:hypothetical protein
VAPATSVATVTAHASFFMSSPDIS